jgi:hypothetical protein
MSTFIGSVDQNVADGAGPFKTGNDRLTAFNSKVDHQGQLFQSPQCQMATFIGSVDQNVANGAGPFEIGNDQLTDQGHDEFEAEFNRFKAEMVPNHGLNAIQAELNRIKAQVVSRELQLNLTNFKYRPMMNSSSNRYDSPVDTSTTNFNYQPTNFLSNRYDSSEFKANNRLNEWGLDFVNDSSSQQLWATRRDWETYDTENGMKEKKDEGLVDTEDTVIKEW